MLAVDFLWILELMCRCGGGSGERSAGWEAALLGSRLSGGLCVELEWRCVGGEGEASGGQRLALAGVV